MILMRLFKIARLVFLASSIAALTAHAVPEQSATASPNTPAPSATADPYHAPPMELQQVKSTAVAHGQQIALQKAALDAYARKKEGNNTAIFPAIGGTAAAIGGIFALRNQNKQAGQERLLKAVELIIGSRHEASL